MRNLRAYALATLSVTIALLGTLVITPLHHQFRGFLFFLAIFVSATGGFWPGVFATLLSVALIDYFLIDPLHSFAISGPWTWFRCFLFMCCGRCDLMDSHRLHRSEEAARAAASVIESSADSISDTVWTTRS